MSSKQIQGVPKDDSHLRDLAKGRKTMTRQANATKAVLLAHRPKEGFGIRRGSGALVHNLTAIQEFVVNAIRQGFTVGAAVDAAGWNRRSLNRLQAQAEREDPNLPPEALEFLAAVREAEHARNGIVVRKITTEAADDVRAAQWLAERYMPEDFSAKQRVELSKGKDLSDDALVEQLYETAMGLPRDNYWRRQLAADLALEYELITQGQADLLVAGDEA